MREMFFPKATMLSVTMLSDFCDQCKKCSKSRFADILVTDLALPLTNALKNVLMECVCSDHGNALSTY